MDLSIPQAAARLGKSPRQVRLLITKGELKARKLGGRWIIAAADLPLSEAQVQAVEHKQLKLRAAVEEGLGLPPETKARYSVHDLKAFQLTLPLHDIAANKLGKDHPATNALRQTMEHLVRGCHRYDYSEKADAYRQARDAASLAICELILSKRDEAADLVTSIEQDLMAALAGLLRRLDRKRLHR